MFSPHSKPNVQAFISYSRADWKCIETLAFEFRCAGIITWVDIENIRPGDRWRPTILGAVRASSAFVFCISPFSLESGRTIWELEEALSSGLLIFPVMIEPTPVAALPEALKQYQILELFREPPATGPKRAAQELGRLLGLPLMEVPVFESGHDIFDTLILRIGNFCNALAPQLFLVNDLTDRDVLNDQAVTTFDRGTVATITGWLKRCSTTYVVVGEGANCTELGLLCGLATAILGAKRVIVVGAPSGLPTASKISHLLGTRLIDRSQLTSNPP
jgi:hypothetical protein